MDSNKFTLLHPDNRVSYYIVTGSVTQIDIVGRNYGEHKPNALCCNYKDNGNALYLLEFK